MGASYASWSWITKLLSTFAIRGQQQRVAIAGELYRDPEIMLFLICFHIYPDPRDAGEAPRCNEGLLNMKG